LTFQDENVPRKESISVPRLCDFASVSPSKH